MVGCSCSCEPNFNFYLKSKKFSFLSRVNLCPNFTNTGFEQCLIIKVCWGPLLKLKIKKRHSPKELYSPPTNLTPASLPEIVVYIQQSTGATASITSLSNEDWQCWTISCVGDKLRWLERSSLDDYEWIRVESKAFNFWNWGIEFEKLNFHRLSPQNFLMRSSKWH